jgi:hypothetical protein
MTGVRVRIREDCFRVLTKALAKPEEVAFLYATYKDGTFDIDGIEVMFGADIASQSKLHVELADDVRPRVIKTAWDTDRCLVESHSHGNWGYAEFSPSDLAGFEEWVTHVRWRLQGRPYLALVQAGETWDALAWTEGDTPSTIDTVEVVDTAGVVVRTLMPTNATAAKLAEEEEDDE